MLNNAALQDDISSSAENIAIFKQPKTQCVSINETAIEKWVGLTAALAYESAIDVLEDMSGEIMSY